VPFRAARDRRPRSALALLGALAVSLLLAGCSAGADTVAGSQASGTPSPAGPVLESPQRESPPPVPTAVPSIAPPPPSSPARRVIEVRVADGKVTGVESRVPAQRGERLELRVTSDVAEQVHVHGYDLIADVAAGATVSVDVDATIPGGFEVELEKSHKTLFQLRVS